jgi:hypothetical protein
MRNVFVASLDFFLNADTDEELVRATLVFHSIEITQHIPLESGGTEEVQPKFIWNQLTNQANH